MKVEIVFEKCETYIFNDYDFDYLHMYDITTCFNMYSPDSIFKEKVINKLSFSLKPLANQYKINSWGENKLPFDRFLQYNDITHISLIYSKKKKENYAVIWEGESEEINSAQKTILVNDHLRVEIKK